MFGMWGPVTDPGETQFSQRVANELGAAIGQSPYRDYDVNTIVAAILALPVTTIKLLWGTSLGCNNVPVVADYVYRQNPKVIIHGAWGFQASLYGAQVGFPPNVLFAHEAYSDNPFNFGLGAYQWTRAAGNNVTNLYLTYNSDLHPGDGDINVQDTFLAEMKRVIATAEAG